MKTLYIDTDGVQSPSEPFELVENEVALLKLVKAETGCILVRGRGASLANWATKIWSGREWPIIHLRSLLYEIKALSCHFDDLSAEEFCERYSDKLKDLSKPLRLNKVLSRLFPNTNLWQDVPSTKHAAKWLLWLNENNPELSMHSLLKTCREAWHRSYSGPESKAYLVCSKQRAEELLCQWIGISDNIVAEFPKYPLPVPSNILQLAQEKWCKKIVESDGTYFDKLYYRKMPFDAKKLASKLAYKYYCEHPDKLSCQVINMLHNFLSQDEYDRLQELLPPKKPGELPSNSHDVIVWFEEEYLPYKRWAFKSNIREDLSHARDIADSFTEWYLNYYPTAVSKGDENLAFYQTNRIAGDRGEVVYLLIVLDGLNAADGFDLIKWLINKEHDLTVIKRTHCFAAIPTITEVCKPALLKGCPPRNIDEAEDIKGSEILPENKLPDEALKQAKHGDFFIWSITEPDRTYHQNADNETIGRNVRGVLKAWVANIVNAARAVPEHLNLRIIITTDHGRLIDTGVRCLDIPEEMKAHQRTAWTTSKTKTLSSGFEIDNELGIVRLNNLYFRISAEGTTLVALNNRAFKTADGKTGNVYFPHGGLSPEEVIAPWYEMERTEKTLSVFCTIKGQARVGSSGDISLHCVNTSEIDAIIKSLVLTFNETNKIEITINEKLSKMGKKIISASLENWPDSLAINRCVGMLYIKPPTGADIRVPVTIEMKVKEFYTQDDILDSLP